nr:hypothetical protein [Tanacetum cinerariifolium]
MWNQEVMQPLIWMSLLVKLDKEVMELRPIWNQSHSKRKQEVETKKCKDYEVETSKTQEECENVESGGDATFNMDESTSQVRQGGHGTKTNMESGGDETGNETVRRGSSLGDFVSVRSEGTSTETRSRGGLATRSRGGLGLRVRRGSSEGTPTTTRSRCGQTLGLRVRKELKQSEDT